MIVLLLFPLLAILPALLVDVAGDIIAKAGRALLDW